MFSEWPGLKKTWQEFIQLNQFVVFWEDDLSKQVFPILFRILSWRVLQNRRFRKSGNENYFFIASPSFIFPVPKLNTLRLMSLVNACTVFFYLSSKKKSFGVGLLTTSYFRHSLWKIETMFFGKNGRENAWGR